MGPYVRAYWPPGPQQLSAKREFVGLHEVVLLILLPEGKLSGLMDIADEEEQMRSVLAANGIVHTHPLDCLELLASLYE